MSAVEYVTFRSRELGFSPVDVRGRCRERKFVKVRVQLAMELRDIGHSFPKIGHALGGRDHTTVMWYLGKIKRRPAKRAPLCTGGDHVCKDCAS